MKPVVIALSLVLVLLCGCKKPATTGQTATLTLQDGSTVTGTVTKSDTASITIQTPNGVVSTYPMSQVSSVSYSPAAGAQQAASPSAPADSSTAAPSSGAPPAAPSVPAETFQTIPANTALAVRTNQPIDSEAAAPGQSYSGVVARDVLDSNGQVAIPRGASATLVVRDSRAQGKVEGRSELMIDVAAVRVGERQYRLETTDLVEKGKEGLGANRRTAEFTGGGGALGGIIGALAGGGKGAAIGALSGAAAGVATQSVTRGKGVRIPAETVLSFQLEAPIRIREMR